MPSFLAWGMGGRAAGIGEKRVDEPHPFLFKCDVETEVPTGEQGRECEVQHRCFRPQISGLKRDTEAECPFG